MSRYQLVGIYFAALVLFNWPFVYREVNAEIYGSSPAQIHIGNSSIPQKLTLAGWPCKFYQSSGTFGDPPRSSFYWSGVGFNLLCWAAIGLALALYVKLGERKPRPLQADDQAHGAAPTSTSAPEPSAKSQRNRVRLRDIFLLTALIALSCSYWQVLKGRRDRDKQLAAEIYSKGGASKSVAMLPVLTKRATPLRSVCLRITEVYLLDPDDALVEKVIALPYLRRLNIAGGSYDLSLLKRLSTNPLLAELAIIGRPLDQQAIATIGSMPALRTLNLMRTNITAQGLNAIGQPNLRELNIIHTDVNLAELGRPSFAGSLRKLQAPHPPTGQGDSLVLEDWPELEEFSCFEYDELLNQEPVVLKLKNLPKLTSIELDALQLFDLELERLPNLSKIKLRQEQWRERATPKQVVPSFAWIRNLRVAEVPKLSELVIFGPQTETIDIDQHSSMTFGISVFNRGYSRNAQTAFAIQLGRGASNALKPGYLTSANIALPLRQKWIDDLAHCTGLDHVDLEAVPLDGLNLAPLLKNRSIRRLSLGYSGLQATQLRDVTRMDQLEEVSLGGLDIDGRTIESLVKSLPNLRALACERSTVARLRLENVPNLESLFEEPQDTDTDSSMEYLMWGGYNYAALDALRIVDAPKLEDYFISDVPLRHLQIEAAPRISGLSFQEPLPPNAVVKGVTNLKFFAAGGATCTDAIVSEVLQSKGLKKLTLAFTQLAPETMQSIARLSDLEYLVLTGSPVDDRLVEAIAGLSKLRVLRLDHTHVTNRSISVVSKLKQLELLDLGEQQISAQDASLLISSLTSLKTLNLAGLALSEEQHLQKIANLTSLRMLDLSRCELSDEQLASLARNAPSSLVELKLNSAKLGTTGFLHLIKNTRSHLRFAVAGTEVDPNLLDWLVSHDRVTSFTDESDRSDITDAQSRLLRARMGMPLENGYEQTFDVSKGEIDPFWFASSQLAGSSSNFGEVSELDTGLDGDGAAPWSRATPLNSLQRLGYELFRWGARPAVID